MIQFSEFLALLWRWGRRSPFDVSGSLRSCLRVAVFGLSLFCLCSSISMADTPPAVVGSHMDLLDDQRALRVGDRMNYWVVEEREAPQPIFVDARGEVDLPLIGAVSAQGKTLRGLAHEIKERLEVDFFHRATVMLRFQQAEHSRGQVDVAGAVRRPRGYPIPTDQILTVSGAITLAGGMAEDANPTEVTLVRRGADSGSPDEEVRQIVNVREILDAGDFEQDVPVQDGDLIVVSRRQERSGGTVYVVGGVNSPGILDVPADGSLTVSKAILQRGGFNRFARKQNVKLLSGDSSLPNDQRTQIVNVGEILEKGLREKDPVVKPNDIIRVEERIIAF